jgi:hypothetical protein
MRLPIPSRATIVFFTVAFAFVFADALDGRSLFTDTDDIVRFLQIRDLVQDNSFFDLRLPFISMPEPYVSHYSRIVDLPYYLVVKLLAPALGVPGAMSVATFLLPPLLLVVFCCLTLYVARRLAGGRFGWLEAVATAFALAPAMLEFTPHRIDHHNFQITLMMAMLAGMFAPAVTGGIAIGLAGAVSVAIGLECLPFVAAGLGALALAAVFDLGDARAKTQLAGLSLALGAAPAAILSLGPPMLWETHCDTISKPWLLGMAGGGLLLTLMPLAWNARLFAGAGRARLLRLASLAVPGAALAAGLALAFPECALGHYNIVDPLSRELWLDTLIQEKGILFQFASGRVSHLLLTVFWAFLLVATVPATRQSLREGRYALAAIHLVALSGFAVFLMLERSVRITSELVGILLPAAILVLRNEGDFGLGAEATRRWLVGALVVPLVAATAIYLAVPKIPFTFTVMDQLHLDHCKAFDAGVLDDVPPSRIMAPLGTAAKIVQNFPQHSVAAFTVHRAAPGMHRMFVAFTTTDPTARAQALAPFDYLAICARDLGFPGMEKSPLYSALLHGQSVPGLIPVEPERDTAFKLYRIDHAAAALAHR